MAVNVLQELEKQYQSGQQKATSLSERLNELDQFDQGTIIPKLNQPLMTGENPAGKYNSLLGLIAGRKADQSSLDSASAGNMDLLNQIYQLQQAEKPDTLSQKDLLELQIKAKQAGLQFDPTTGALIPETPQGKTDESKALELVNTLIKGNYQAVSGGFRTPDWVARLGIIPGAGEAKTAWEGLGQLLALAKRGELKGSGTISDFEAKMLQKAALAGLDPNTQSESEFLKGLQQLKKDLEAGGAVDYTQEENQVNDDPLGIMKNKS